HRMTEREGARTLRPAGERHQANPVVGPAVEMVPVRSVAPGDEEAKGLLGGLEPADGLTGPAEVAGAHAAADVEHDFDGHAFRGDARPPVREPRPCQGDDQY